MKILSTISSLDLNISPGDAAYILRNTDYLSFLDSSLSGSKYSRFSYIAWEPKLILKSSGCKNQFISSTAGIAYYSYQHPLSFLKQNIRNYIPGFSGSGSENINTLYLSRGKVGEISRTAAKNLPDFRGGFIGYFSYDLKNYIEKLPSKAVDDTGIPLFYLMYYDRLLAYSHRNRKWYFIKNFPYKEAAGLEGEDSKEGNLLQTVFGEDEYINRKIKDKDLEERINLNINGIPELLQQTNNKRSSIKKNIVKKYSLKDFPDIKLYPNIGKSDYIEKVIKIKQYIHNGHIYQANFSQRFKANLAVEPMDLYYILREKNAAPFSAFLKFPDFCIGSSSPERFLFLKGDIIETRPIKGTRPRGMDARSDYKNMVELKNSVKDIAELNMIVDLERNDLGKFCYYGTVKVAEHAVIEKYARVFHSVSTVTGQIKKGTDISDMLKAAFPGGSITGAPKIRAMEIIDEMEPTARGVYTGSIGYVGIDSTIDLNIVIRTFVIKGNKFYYNVGGGIVEDSVPEEEYTETLDKGIALEETLKYFSGKNLKKQVKASKI